MPTSSSCASSEKDALSMSDTVGVYVPLYTGAVPSSVVNCTRDTVVSAVGEFEWYLLVAVSSSPSS